MTTTNTKATTFLLKKYSTCNSDGRWHTYPSRSGLALLVRPHLEGANICVYWKSSCLLLFDLAFSNGSCFSCVSRNTTLSLKELSSRGAFIRRFQVTVVDTVQHATLLELFKSHLGIVVKLQDNSEGISNLLFPSFLGQQFTPCLSQQFSPYPNQQFPPHLSQQFPTYLSQQFPPRLSQSNRSQPRPENLGSQDTFGQGHKIPSTGALSLPFDPHWELPSQAHAHGNSQSEHSQFAFPAMSPPSHSYPPNKWNLNLDCNYSPYPSSQSQRPTVNSHPRSRQVTDLDYSVEDHHAMGASGSINLLNNIQILPQDQNQREGSFAPPLLFPQLLILLGLQTESTRERVAPSGKTRQKKQVETPTKAAKMNVLSRKTGKKLDTGAAIRREVPIEISPESMSDLQLRQLVVETLKSKEFLDLLLRVDKIVGELAS